MVATGNGHGLGFNHTSSDCASSFLWMGNQIAGRDELEKGETKKVPRSGAR
jgi:hypothetical protein